mgnify:CR=1 FL=1
MKELGNVLNKLNLLGMKESLDYRLAEGMKSNQSYQDLLMLLLEDESLYRENRKSEVLRKRAKFRDRVALEEYDFSPNRGVNKSMVKQMQALRFIDENENILFIGGTGAGKSFLAQALGHAACHAGHETYFVSVNILFSQIAAAEAAGNYLTLHKKLAQTKLLILDDFALRNYTHHEATLLYQILEERYRKGSTIITSQVKPKGWKSLYEDPVIAEAINDRLVSCAHVIEMNAAVTYRSNYTPKKKMAVDA